MQRGVRNVRECNKQMRAVCKRAVLQHDIKHVHFDLQWSDNLTRGQFINKQRMRALMSNQILRTEQHMHGMPWVMLHMHIGWQLLIMHKHVSNLTLRNVLLIMPSVSAISLQQYNMSSVRYWRVPELPE